MEEKIHTQMLVRVGELNISLKSSLITVSIYYSSHAVFFSISLKGVTCLFFWKIILNKKKKK